MVTTIKEILQQGSKQLSAQGISTARLDARILLGFAIDLSTEKLLLNSDQQLSVEQIEYYHELLECRSMFKPVAYIIGKKEFYGLDFIINEKVLIPRPDSEVLIDAALRYAKKLKITNILELGVGSGCLLLSILYNLSSTINATAIDISDGAIEVVKENYQKLGLKNQVRFLIQNWQDSIEDKYDLIIANPPYIESAEIDNLQVDVRNYEPELALDGGVDGLNCYREIAQQLPKIMTVNGIVLFEIGKGQEKAITSIVQSYNLQVIEYVYDLAGIIRCLVIKIS